MSQNITVSWRRSASRRQSWGRRAVVRWLRARASARQLAIARISRLRSPSVTELRQVGLGQIGKHVEIDLVLGERRGVSAEADLLAIR
jgi:hypothetical protein